MSSRQILWRVPFFTIVRKSLESVIIQWKCKFEEVQTIPDAQSITDFILCNFILRIWIIYFISKLLVPTNLLMSDSRVTGFQKYNKTEQIILDTEENVSENKESMPEVEIDISEIDESIPEVEMRMPETMRI